MATSDIYNQQMTAFDNSLPSNAGNYGWWNNITGDASAQATNNLFNAQQAAMANQFSHDEAQLTRDWQERMSNTAYQRAMADMKAAGINPLNMSGGIEPASAATSAVGQAHQGHAAGMPSNSLPAFILGLVKVGASIATAGASNAAKISSATLSANAKENAALIGSHAKEKVAQWQLSRKDILAKIYNFAYFRDQLKDKYYHNGHWDKGDYAMQYFAYDRKIDRLWSKIHNHDWR